MNLEPDVITVNKLVRLGRRENNSDGTVKCRPLRFTVDVFDQKRQILTVNSLLRSCEHDILASYISLQICQKFNGREHLN